MIVLNDYEVHALFVDAARYAIGRGSYVSSSTAGIIKAHIGGLTPGTCYILARDIRRYDKDYGHRSSGMFYDLDIKPFVDLLPALDARAGEGE